MALHNTLVVLMLVLSLRGQVQTGKIIGGHPAVPHGRPYMVLLERRMWNDETKFCGGFLISDQFVVTAAHCQARIYNVYVGLHEFKNDQTPKAIQVCQAIPHEDYNEKPMLNDLMLLQLSEKVNITEHVRPINLASRVDHLPQRCMVSGWGYSEENPNDMASELREVNVTLVKHTLPADRHVYSTLGESGPSNVSDNIIIHIICIHIWLLLHESKVDPKANSYVQLYFSVSSESVGAVCSNLFMCDYRETLAVHLFVKVKWRTVLCQAAHRNSNCTLKSQTILVGF
uniref:trypsin n=1 Tax=Gadus morhua TaxID=8049 RepID=A0A8C5A9D1_GADMO